jgi:hypothetical protein
MFYGPFGQRKNKKAILLITLVWFGIVASAQNSVTETYKYAVNEYLSNEAEAILLGDISRLSGKYIIDIISLSKLKSDSLSLLRSLIYARHGEIFESQDLKKYFTQFDWYIPKGKVSDNALSSIERNNIQVIQQFEKIDEDGELIKWGKEKEGVWQDFYGFAAGWGDRFVIYADNKIEYIYSQMRQLKVINRLVGTYEIKGNALEFKVTQIDIYDHDQVIEFSGGFGYQWMNSSSNTITFKIPEVLRFPISHIRKTNEYNDPDVYSVMIGGTNFYRMEKDVSKKY